MNSIITLDLVAMLLTVIYLAKLVIRNSGQMLPGHMGISSIGLIEPKRSLKNQRVERR